MASGKRGRGRMTETRKKPMRVLLVDDHTLFRESVSTVLSARENLEIAHCGSIRDAVACLGQDSFDLVLLDHDLGSERASQFLPAARERGFEGRVLVVTAWISDNEARRLLRQGVSGIFFKHGPLAELTESIRTVAAGGTWLDQGLTAVKDDDERGEAPSPAFTDRQRKVLRFV